MTWIRRGLAVGAGFGLSAAAFDLWYGMIGVPQLRMAPGPVTLTRNAWVLIALGTAIGLLTAVILRSRGRAAPFLHLACVCAVWYAIERWLWIDSMRFEVGAVARTFGSGALVLVALLLGRWAPRLATLPWGFAAVAAVGGILAPGAYLGTTTPSLPSRAALPPAREGAPDVMLVVLDTVRADSVGSYGHYRDTTPNFDALAREGALFLDATSPSTWSLPSHASLFTGRYPTGHGAYRQPSFLDARFPTVAEALAAHGYETFCFTANPWISDGLGLARGFAVQSLSWKSKSISSFASRLLERIGFGEQDKGGGAVAAEFARWRRARAEGRPSFVFLNFIEAHYPYHQIPSEFRDRYSDLPPAELRRISRRILDQQLGGPKADVAAVATPARDLYDGGVAYTDALLGRVVDAVRESGRLDRTVLVVLADHGEMLGERGGLFGHGPTLYQRMIHVPLLVRYPPRIARGARVQPPVSTVGVFATILDLAGIEPPPTLQVGSLVRPEHGLAGEPVLSEKVSVIQSAMRGDGPDPQMLRRQDLRAYRSGSWKLVEASPGGRFLYDLVRDPTEARDLAAELPDQVKRLAADLENVRARLGLPKLDAIGAGARAPELDPATQQRLRELGYLK